MMNPRPTSRTIVIGVGLAVGLGLGLRPTTTVASPWSDARFKGTGNAELRLTRESSEGPHEVVAFTRLVFGTEASIFPNGLVLRTDFHVPNSSGRVAGLSIDIDRAPDRTLWAGEAADTMIGRYYEVEGPAGPVVFDAEAEEGNLRLDAIVVGSQLVGFRILGELRFIDPGADRMVGTEDDESRYIDIVLESEPLPEDLQADPTLAPPLPMDPPCDPEWCYQDPYYADEVYGGCDGSYESDSAYGDDSGGCEGDSYDDEPDYGGDGCEGDTYDDGGSYDSGSDTGCDSSDSDGYSSSSSGCEGDSFDSGSSGSSCGGGEGCGDSGCSGDTLAAEPMVHVRRAAKPWHEVMIGWAPLLALFGLVLLIHAPGRRRR